MGYFLVEASGHTAYSFVSEIFCWKGWLGFIHFQNVSIEIRLLPDQANFIPSNFLLQYSFRICPAETVLECSCKPYEKLNLLFIKRPIFLNRLTLLNLIFRGLHFCVCLLSVLVCCLLSKRLGPVRAYLNTELECIVLAEK